MKKVRTISFFFKNSSDASLLKRDIANCQFKTGFKIPVKYLEFGAVITTAEIKELYVDLQKNLSREIINFTISDETWETKICGYGHDEGTVIDDLTAIKTYEYIVRGNKYTISHDNTHIYTDDNGSIYKGVFI
jgi:hypothetical protein